MGVLYEGIGESHQALAQWRQAITLAPDWVTPRLRVARLLRLNGQGRRALREAQDAAKLAPKDPQAITVLAETWLDAGPSDRAAWAAEEPLLNWLEKIQQSQLGEPWSLPMYVRLLARRGKRDRAIAILNRVLDATSVRYDATYWIELARLSRTESLGLESRCLKRCREAYPQSAELALTEALFELEDQGRGEATERFIRMAQSQTSDRVWRSAWVRFLEMVGEANAPEMWERLVLDFPDDGTLVRQALRSNLIWSDRSRVDRMIDRLRAISGDDGHAWQVHRARWWLESEDPELQHRADAMLRDLIAKAPEDIEPRLLLASHLERQGQIPDAVEQLKTVARYQPRDEPLALRLARMQLQIGQIEEARGVLSHLETSDHLSPLQRQELALLLERSGDRKRAAEMLHALDSQPLDKMPISLALAELLGRLGERDRAESVYTQLLKQPNASVLASYAEFQAQLGRLDAAVTTLKQLESMNLQPGRFELILAVFLGRYARVADPHEPHPADRLFASAAQRLPASEAVYAPWINLHLNRGDFNRAIEINAMARTAMPEAEQFKRIESAADLIRIAAKDARLKPLAMACLRGGSEGEAATAALRLLSSGSTRDLKDLSRLRRLADEHPQFSDLQLILVQLYSDLGHVEDAVSVASRAMRAMPTDPRPAERAAQVLRQHRRWAELLGIVAQWRDRMPEGAIEPDHFAAEAYLALRVPGKAVKTLEVHEAVMRKAPEVYEKTLRLLIRGLFVTDQMDRLLTLLEATAPQAAALRTLWMDLALEQTDTQMSIAWLKRVHPMIPEEAMMEHVAFAHHWYTLGRRSGDDVLRQRGLALLRERVTSEAAPAHAIAALASILYQEGDVVGAETAYRRAIQKDPRHALSLNNLAMILLEKGRDLDEAAGLGQRAVDSASQVPGFRDTLAQLLIEQKQYGKAIEQLEIAVRLDPDEMAWRIHLIEAQLLKGDINLARRHWSEARLMITEPQQLPPDQRKRWLALDERIRAGQPVAP